MTEKTPETEKNLDSREVLREQGSSLRAVKIPGAEKNPGNGEEFREWERILRISKNSGNRKFPGMKRTGENE